MRYYKVYSNAVRTAKHVREVTNSMELIEALIESLYDESPASDIVDSDEYLRVWGRALDYGLDKAAELLQSGRPVECGDFAIYAVEDEGDVPAPDNSYYYTPLLKGFKFKED